MFSFFEKRLKPFPDELPGRPPATLWAFCWYYTRGVWQWLLLMSLFVAIIALIEVSLFGFLGNIVDWLATADRETFLEQEGSTLVMIGAVVLLGLPLLSLLVSTIIHQTLMGNYPMRIRWMAHQYLLRQSFGFYQDEFAGRIATKVMQTALGVREAVMKLMDVLVYIGVYFLGGMVLVASFDVRIITPFLVWLALYVAVLSRLLPRLHQVSKEQADARSMMTGRIVDSYTNIMTVKLFAHAQQEEAYARESMDDFLGKVYKMMRLGTWLDVSIDTLNALLLFAVGFVSIGSWLLGDSSIGGIAVAIGLVLRMHGMSHWIMWELAGLFENLGMAHDGMNMLSKVQSVTDIADAPPLKVTRGEVNFDRITFHYGKDKGVIDDFSLHIQPGEKVGLVGRSGAGKTTLMNVLLRLFDLESGRILIDGQNIAEVSQESLRAQIGVVTQETSLLHRSIGENIAYGRNHATQEDIISAAKRANAHDFIMDLHDLDGRQGYDARVGERGAKLSGGQRQRISIARMFLKDAPILVLDEATSALDSEVEAAIQENLMDLMKGKTVLAIAHRLSTISALDRLVVIDRGSIIEQGSHEALIAQKGLYSELWRRQSGGFIE
ncbi:ABC transporter, permease/ATP-binding protein [Luminiphilus syltensis NOR5-1B]|uniref:ABC transporter, permease/ATP-binding protein n=1 Tax=Luminiphilus syltensis NOR5-1B TaxID=565045 RepID=B8KX69_9GAMM|nr:ABC transporter ATP-binding protein [Luminiphilus syltensis]EED34556.1 ABC transporter, permease/ATP-binding protein [Luminiphilus syltensis NOR5-1B]